MTVEIESSPAAHVVQFYENDQQLVRTVSGYVAGCLRSGDVAVVVATPDHSRAFDAALAAAGVDIAAAGLGGNLVHADAGATLSRFMVGGAPDPDEFDAVVGALVRRAADGGRRVRIYGEMVALLWDAGQVAAAIELEELWNELGRRLPFELLCAYPTPSVRGPDHVEAYRDICRLHGAVIGDEAFPEAEVVRRYVSSPEAPRDARRFVAEILEKWGHADLVDDAMLVVTELATNATVHARSDFVVSVQRRNAGIRIAVRDASPALPVPGTSSAAATSGRGLALVSRIAGRWGHHALEGGKVVWAELRG